MAEIFWYLDGFGDRDPAYVPVTERRVADDSVSAEKCKRRCVSHSRAQVKDKRERT